MNGVRMDSSSDFPSDQMFSTDRKAWSALVGLCHRTLLDKEMVVGSQRMKRSAAAIAKDVKQRCVVPPPMILMQ